MTVEELWKLRETMLHLRRCSLRPDAIPGSGILVEAFGFSAIRLGTEVMQSQISASQRRP